MTVAFVGFFYDGFPVLGTTACFQQGMFLKEMEWVKNQHVKTS